MARILLSFFILLLGISYSYADSLPAEETERQAKVRKLDQLAEKFKAETRFRGEITYSTERMRLSHFEGKFPDIQITAYADTASFRAVFEQILDKVLPFTFAKREHLTRSRITNNLGRTKTEYYQQVNGYRVDRAGKISIVYETGRNDFAIGNGTVVLPSQNITPVLTYEDAVRIYDENVEDDEATIKFRKERPFLGLRFSNIYNDWEGDTRSEYRLCWVGGNTRWICIDAITGQVYKIVDMTMY